MDDTSLSLPVAQVLAETTVQPIGILASFKTQTFPVS